MNGKGSTRRPEDRKAIEANWARVFGKKSLRVQLTRVILTHHHGPGVCSGHTQDHHGNQG